MIVIVFHMISHVGLCNYRFYISLAKKIMAQRKRDGKVGSYSDTLDVMTKAANEGNEAMTEANIAATVMQFFFDG